MNDAFLVGMLDRCADDQKQLDSLFRGETVLVAVLGDSDAADEFHDKVGPAIARRAAVKHSGDIAVIHQRQSLPLGLKAGDDFLRIHAWLDDLQRDFAHDGLGLFGHVDRSEPSFANLLE